jgi:hypothetical protein
MVPLFDVLSAIEISVYAAVVVALLAFALARTIPGRLGATFVLALWFAGVVALGATGALDATTGIGAPGLGVAVVLPAALLSLAFLREGRAREAIAAMPLWALIAVHVPRLLGVFFVLLYAAHRLPAPFAPAAGWGDMIAGAAAVPLAWLAWRGGAARGLMLAWNAFGLLDLVTAIALGATSSPGPLQLFTEPPGTPLMVTLPWILIPGFLVPGLAALHIAIFDRLSRSGGRVPVAAVRAS